MKVADRCTVCDLYLGGEDVGDGPIPFITLILGFIVVGLAVWVEFSYEPSLWLHAVLWPPLIIGASLIQLRYLKALLIALQFKHRAEEYDEKE